jgi:hypothetical protein
LPGYRDGRANSDYLLPAADGGAEGAEEVVMSKVVLDVSMSLDGFIAGPNDPRLLPIRRTNAACEQDDKIGLRSRWSTRHDLR